MLTLVACGDSGTTTTIDSAPPVTQDCATYCTEIQTNCTGANAQYPAEATNAHCLATCASFPMGTAADMAGNTLGCRIYHAGTPSMTAPDTHCVHAGPGGDKTSAAAPGTCGDACTSFCTLEIKACGLTGDAGGNGQYASAAACMTACAGFDKTHLYGLTASGDSLACRLYHATNAAISGNATVHCPHTAAAPAGAANPCLAGKPPTP
jgi:hypothetical protein